MRASAVSSRSPDSRGAVCTSVTASSIPDALKEIDEAIAAGADILELRLDFLGGLQVAQDLPQLLQACGSVPSIVTYRPDWEGGRYSGDEEARLAALSFAASNSAPFIDIELKAAEAFFANGPVASDCKVIISSHDYEGTGSTEALQAQIDAMWAAGADIVKLATTATDITHSMRMLRLLEPITQGPAIMLSMGERGQPSRLLAAKYGAFLTFGALSQGRESAPGQPSVADLLGRYNLHAHTAATKVFGIIGNPVSHSKSPAIHNAAFQSIGFDGVYIPCLVDDLPAFLEAADDPSIAGFSVTIPHKEAALAAAEEVDPVAASIGAVNTLVRLPSGGFKGYNTDWSGAIGALEAKLGVSGPDSLAGKVVVVVGAGGAGRALAFGAASKGASVVVANRNVERARTLVGGMSGDVTAVALSELQGGGVSGDVLMNSTSLGMAPLEDETPLPAEQLHNFKLVFDAVYTPRETRLLREAAAAGCGVVDGVEMFVGQAVEQFKLFTGEEAPVALMTGVVTGEVAA